MPSSGSEAARTRRSQTADWRLVGAADAGAQARIAAELATIPAMRDCGPSVAAQLVARHGTEAPAVVALGAELDLLRPLVAGRAFLEAEVAWAARQELAFSLDDVLARRTRLAQELPDRGAAIAPRVAQILGRGARLGRIAAGAGGPELPRVGPPRVRGRPARATRPDGHDAGSG